MGFDNEWLFPMGPRQHLKRFSPQAGIDAGVKLETARSADHHLRYRDTGVVEAACACVWFGVGAVRVCVY